MNFCNLPQWIIFRLLTKSSFLLFLIVICTLNAQNIERDFLQWSEVIESSKTSNNEKQKAVEKIIAMGKDILPLVEKKLQETKISHYFYIWESIQASKRQSAEWQKQFYFKEKYQKALLFAEQKNYDEAIKIIDSILVLEPKISFAPQAIALLEKLRKEKNPGDHFIAIDILPLVKYYAFTDELKLSLSIKNLSSVPVTMYFGREYLDFKITNKEFYLSGNSRTDSQTKSVRIKKQITISGGGYWERIITIPQNNTTNNCYQEMEVETSIKLVTLEIDDKKYFPKINFPKRTLKIFPKSYHSVVSNPIAYFTGAINLQKMELLFYTSFWIPEKDMTTAISLLIDNLEQLTLSPMMKSILIRFTKEDYSSIGLWKNWWYARKSFYDE